MILCRAVTFALKKAVIPICMMKLIDKIDNLYDEFKDTITAGNEP